jgi:hypothetical protein
MPTIVEVKAGAEEGMIHKAQLAGYMEMVKENSGLESPGLERIEMKNDKGETWHEYFDNEKFIPGVTTLLSLYRTWQFDNDAGKEAAERGSWIHKILANYDRANHRDAFFNWANDKKGLPKLKDGEFASKCFLSYLRFLDDYRLEGVEVKNEVSLAGEGYAGTLDKIYMTPGKLTGGLLYLGKKYKYIPMTRRSYWVAFLKAALLVWQVNPKSQGFRQNKKNTEVKDGNEGTEN